MAIFQRDQGTQMPSSCSPHISQEGQMDRISIIWIGSERHTNFLQFKEGDEVALSRGTCWLFMQHTMTMRLLYFELDIALATLKLNRKMLFKLIQQLLELSFFMYYFGRSLFFGKSRT